MSTTRISTLLALAVAVAFVALRADEARAWVAWGPVWAQHNTTYDTSALSSSWRPVADFGAQQWTDVTNSDWTYNSDNSSSNDITVGSIDGSGGVLATTTIYFSGGIINRAVIKFDSSENWYLGTGAPGGSQMDGRSVASHEFGHALGLDHTQSGNCPSGSGRATMCASYPVGTSYMRSLEADDQDGVSALYPLSPTATPTHTPSNTPTAGPTATPTATDAFTIGGPRPTDTPTPRPPTQTPTSAATQTVAPTSSPIPTSTPEASPTRTPVPTRTPTNPPMCIGC